MAGPVPPGLSSPAKQRSRAPPPQQYQQAPPPQQQPYPPQHVHQQQHQQYPPQYAQYPPGGPPAERRDAPQQQYAPPQQHHQHQQQQQQQFQHAHAHPGQTQKQQHEHNVHQYGHEQRQRAAAAAASLEPSPHPPAASSWDANVPLPDGARIISHRVLDIGLGHERASPSKSSSSWHEAQNAPKSSSWHEAQNAPPAPQQQPPPPQQQQQQYRPQQSPQRVAFQPGPKPQKPQQWQQNSQKNPQQNPQQYAWANQYGPPPPQGYGPPPPQGYGPPPPQGYGPPRPYPHPYGMAPPPGSARGPPPFPPQPAAMPESKLSQASYEELSLRDSPKSEKEARVHLTRQQQLADEAKRTLYESPPLPARRTSSAYSHTSLPGGFASPDGKVAEPEVTILANNEGADTTRSVIINTPEQARKLQPPTDGPHPQALEPDSDDDGAPIVVKTVFQAHGQSPGNRKIVAPARPLTDQLRHDRVHGVRRSPASAAGGKRHISDSPESMTDLVGHKQRRMSAAEENESDDETSEPPLAAVARQVDDEVDVSHVDLANASDEPIDLASLVSARAPVPSADDAQARRQEELIARLEKLVFVQQEELKNAKNAMSSQQNEMNALRGQLTSVTAKLDAVMTARPVKQAEHVGYQNAYPQGHLQPRQTASPQVHNEQAVDSPRTFTPVRATKSAAARGKPAALRPTKSAASPAAHGKGWNSSTNLERGPTPVRSLESTEKHAPLHRSFSATSASSAGGSTPVVHVNVRSPAKSGSPRRTTDAWATGVRGDHSVTVAVHVRGFSSRETRESIVDMDEHGVVLTNPVKGTLRQFDADRFFDSSPSEARATHAPEIASPQLIHQKLGAELVAMALQGYDASLFSYGPHSAAKTFSIVGKRESRGVLAHTLYDLFSRLQTLEQDAAASVKVDVSVLEIIGSTVTDLLVGDGKALAILESSKKKAYVSGKKRVHVASLKDVEAALATAAANADGGPPRARKNRRHYLLEVYVTIHRDGQPDAISKLMFVELAVAEASGTTDSAPGAGGSKAVRDASLASTSLSVLNYCLSGLNKESTRNKFRESPLTRLLYNQLSKKKSTTAVVVGISPSSDHFDDSTMALRFAERLQTHG